MRMRIRSATASTISLVQDTSRYVLAGFTESRLTAIDMSDSSHYVIRGGVEGRERLRVIARVMRASSMSMFDRLGLRDGCQCLDVGCGGGDVTLDLARRVGPHGRVVGVDIDEKKLEIARTEARQLGVANVEFRVADVRDEP